jgi:hypothetical protein
MAKWVAVFPGTGFGTETIGYPRDKVEEQASCCTICPDGSLTLGFERVLNSNAYSPCQGVGRSKLPSTVKALVGYVEVDTRLTQSIVLDFREVCVGAGLGAVVCDQEITASFNGSFYGLKGAVDCQSHLLHDRATSYPEAVSSLIRARNVQ